ncbi:MAG: DUF4012 domain-containing protein [bacterium]|nr:DUF4012 domain-containing protein [bacterium]
MPKQHSLKFWIIFWSIAIVFLAGLYFFLEAKKQPGKVISGAIDFLPIELSQKTEYKSIAYFANYLLAQDDMEKAFLILFQNNMELRPGGGFIGAFGILKIKNGKVIEFQSHDLSNFDGRIPSNIEPPYPMKETLRIDSWKLRDSNWSPDFSENAKKAEYFYRLGQGQENFDGIVAINTNVLNSFLKITGPVTLPDYPGEFNSENAVLNLEYQVEKGYAEQGIEKGERKTIMNELADVLMEKVFTLNNSQKFDLAKIILEDLNNKNIQLYFKDQDLENQAENSLWAGETNSTWAGDYLMMIDANLASYKSDYYIDRSFDYTINLSGEKPIATLKITYTHRGKVQDWMTKDYQTYLRVYAPKDAWLENSNNVGKINFGEEFGKKYFGTLFTVPLNQTKTVEFNYTLKDLDTENYDLLIQKQSGVSQLPGKITVINKNGERKGYDVKVENEWKLNEHK